ncbi:MAG: IS110 family transposase [Acidobacteriota bacterium]
MKRTNRKRSRNIPDSRKLPLETLAACVGLDWGDTRHAGALLPAGSQQVETFDLEQTPEALDQWAHQLRERFGGRPVAVCLEQSRGPLIYALLRFDFLILCPINPKQLARYREALQPSGAKDDPGDAAVILDFLVKHSDRVRVWKPDRADVRLIAQLCEARRDLVDRQVALSGAWKSHLKHFFPQAIALFGGELNTPLACAFLKKWPTLQRLQRARPQTIRRFFYAHNSRSESRLQERLALIAAAKPLCTDPTVVETHSRMAQALRAQLDSLRKPIAEMEQRIEELLQGIEDAKLFQALPGAGAALAPRLLAAFGTDRERYESADEIACYCGEAPVTQQSGKTMHNVRFRRACPKFLRQTFHEFAWSSTKHCRWARAYYDMKKSQGKRHHAAVRALAIRWIRILFRCWKNHTTYDELSYLNALQKQNSPCLNFLKPNPA